MASPVAPHITARVQMTETGSWVGGAPGPEKDIRTTLSVGGVFHMVRFTTSSGTDFILGKPVEVPIEFFAPELALPKFVPGTHFKIWAGKDIGIGEVLATQGTSNTSFEQTRDV